LAGLFTSEIDRKEGIEWHGKHPNKTGLLAMCR
jgi:hypothetical protein